MTRNPRTRCLLSCIVALLLCSVGRHEAFGCKELMAVVGGAETKDFSKVEKADENLLSSIKKARPYDILVLHEKVLCDPNVKAALAESPARLVLRSVGDTRSLCAKHIQSMSVIAVFPTTEDGVRNVFPERPVRATQSYLLHVKSTMEELQKLRSGDQSTPGLVDVVVLDQKPAKGSMSEQLLDAVRTTKATEFVLLICHSEKGLIPLPDGSAVKLTELEKVLDKRTAVILTCNSIDYTESGVDAVVTTRKLEFDEVAKAVLAIGKTEFYGKCHDFGEMLGRLNSELAKGKGPADGIVRWGAISLFGGITVFAIVQLRRGSDTEQCSCGATCNCALDTDSKCKCKRPQEKKKP